MINYDFHHYFWGVISHLQKAEKSRKQLVILNLRDLEYKGICTHSTPQPAKTYKITVKGGNFCHLPAFK